MKEYTGFAYSYDMFMDNVPYDEWAEYLHGLLIENGVKDGIVCELGCGTGKMTRKLRDFGYDLVKRKEIILRGKEEEKKRKNQVMNRERYCILTKTCVSLNFTDLWQRL